MKAVVEDVGLEQKMVFLRLGTSLRAMAEMEEEQKQDKAEPAGARQPSITVRVGDVVNVKITEKNNQVEARYRVAIQPRTVVQAALVCMDARTGEIKAMVGGRDFSSSEFNRATQARRQPGSAFKPLIYTAAFDKGLTPATVMVDEPLSFPDPYRGEWRPQNADRKFGGLRACARLSFTRAILLPSRCSSRSGWTMPQITRRTWGSHRRSQGTFHWRSGPRG